VEVEDRPAGTTVAMLVWASRPRALIGVSAYGMGLRNAPAEAPMHSERGRRLTCTQVGGFPLPSFSVCSACHG
jgi:hypothetical protein